MATEETTGRRTILTVPLDQAEAKVDMALKVAEVTNLGQLGKLWIVTGGGGERLRRVVQRGREEAQLDTSSAFELDRLRSLAIGCLKEGAGLGIARSCSACPRRRRRCCAPGWSSGV